VQLKRIGVKQYKGEEVQSGRYREAVKLLINGNILKRRKKSDFEEKSK
jgi:hypothetical protein